MTQYDQKSNVYLIIIQEDGNTTTIPLMKY